MRVIECEKGNRNGDSNFFGDNSLNAGCAVVMRFIWGLFLHDVGLSDMAVNGSSKPLALQGLHFSIFRLLYCSFDSIDVYLHQGLKGNQIKHDLEATPRLLNNSIQQYNLSKAPIQKTETFANSRTLFTPIFTIRNAHQIAALEARNQLSPPDIQHHDSASLPAIYSAPSGAITHLTLK